MAKPTATCQSGDQSEWNEYATLQKCTVFNFLKHRAGKTCPLLKLPLVPAEQNDLHKAGIAGNVISRERCCNVHNVKFMACFKLVKSRTLTNNPILCLGNDALNFVGNNTEEYGIASGLNRSLTAVSSCFWINTPASYPEQTGNYAPTMISYSISGGNDYVVMVLRGSLRVFRSLTLFTYVINYCTYRKIIST